MAVVGILVRLGHLRLALTVLLISGCALNPSGYNQWDGDLSLTYIEEYETIDGLLDAVHAKWKYRRDKQEHWQIPILDSEDRYRGDCEDFALLVAAHLKLQGVSTRLVAAYRQYHAEFTGELRTIRHAMLLLPDGRFVDNRHKRPFSRHEYEVYWTSPEL